MENRDRDRERERQVNYRRFRDIYSHFFPYSTQKSLIRIDVWLMFLPWFSDDDTIKLQPNLLPSPLRFSFPLSLSISSQAYGIYIYIRGLLKLQLLTQHLPSWILPPAVVIASSSIESRILWKFYAGALHRLSAILFLGMASCRLGILNCVCAYGQGQESVSYVCGSFLHLTSQLP